MAVVHLSPALLHLLDDWMAVAREFICSEVSRSDLDRCPRLHDVGNLNILNSAEPKESTRLLKSYLHMYVKHLPQMQDESQRRYLFVTIGRATRWVLRRSSLPRQRAPRYS